MFPVTTPHDHVSFKCQAKHKPTGRYVTFDILSCILVAIHVQISKHFKVIQLNVHDH
jgi:hypothetical protein